MTIESCDNNRVINAAVSLGNEEILDLAEEFPDGM